MHFHHLFELATDIFRGTAPRPDAINELVGGDEMAMWLLERLNERGITCHSPHAEDHGWGFEFRSDGRRYLVVCSCEFEDEGASTDRHFVQLAQTKGEAVEPDPILVLIRDVLMAAPELHVSADGPVRRR